MNQFRSLTRFVLIITGLYLASAQSGTAKALAKAASPLIHHAQIEVHIPFAPQLVTGSDGQRHLAFELRVTSFQADDDLIRLTRLAIFAGEAGARCGSTRAPVFAACSIAP